jgi:hypothetical protein
MAEPIPTRADHAMDRAKQTGRYRVLPFSDQIASPRAERSDIWPSVLRGGLPAGRRCHATAHDNPLPPIPGHQESRKDGRLASSRAHTTGTA